MPFSRQQAIAPAQGLPSRDITISEVWRSLNATTLRIAAWLGPALIPLYVVLYVTTQRAVWLAVTALSVVITAQSWWRLRIGHHDAEPVMLLGGITTMAATFVVPDVVRGVLVAAITLFAVVGVLVLPNRGRRRLLVASFLILGSTMLWPAFGVDSLGVAVASWGIGTATLTFGGLAVTLARRHLEASEATRLDIFRSVPVGLFRIDPDGQLVDANPQFAEMLGYEGPHELRHAAVIKLYVDSREWEGLDREMHASSQPVRFDHRLRKSDGSVLWARGFAQAVRSESGRVRYYEGAIEDATQRRIVEEKAQLAGERFRNVFERAPIALWEENFDRVARRLLDLRRNGVTDIRTHLRENPEELTHLLGLIDYIDVNPAGTELLGASSREEALARVVPETPTEELAGSFIEQIAAIWEDRDHLQLDVTGSTVDGDPIDIVINWACARDARGRLDPSSVIVAISDVTLIRRAERELAALVESKDELVASVSHELRTPITTILGLAYELRDRGSNFTFEEAADLISLIADQSRELNDIVEDLLVAARADAGTLVVTPQTVEVKAEIDALSATDAVPSTADVRVDGEVAAWADPLRFRQIIRNLLSNAARYGGANIVIDAKYHGDEVVVRVIDDGPGIDPTDQEAIFEPYVRAAGEEGLPGAIGLGLPVSRRLARLMGGDLAYRYDDHSIFELRLPARDGVLTAA